MKICMYGGTFDPPHIGHVEAAEAFVREMKLDKLLIIPTFIPPHKSRGDNTSTEDRLAMCRYAFSHIPKAEISDMEIKRGGTSYTYLTLEELSGNGTELFFLCGTDMILTFDLWRKYEYIFSLATICYARRERDKAISHKIQEKVRQYRSLDAKIIEIDHDVTEISSSDIREGLAHRKAQRYIPQSVLDYIEEKRLYQ